MEVEEAVTLALSAQQGEALPLPPLSTQDHNQSAPPSMSPLQRRPVSPLAGRATLTRGQSGNRLVGRESPIASIPRYTDGRRTPPGPEMEEVAQGRDG
jgi:hypothetical protein